MSSNDNLLDTWERFKCILVASQAEADKHSDSQEQIADLGNFCIEVMNQHPNYIRALTIFALVDCCVEDARPYTRMKQ